jgi:hypothetical protein
MKCPHCLTAFHDESNSIPLGEDIDSDWSIIVRACPTCRKSIISLYQRYDRYIAQGAKQYRRKREFLCYPKATSRAPISKDVPDKYAKDYHEGCLTLSDSPKASAALSRRCLQLLLREEAKVKPGNLADEIQQVLDEGKLSTHILESLDAIRNIGNFAAHPIKSKSSGEIIEVEPGEAEWNLDVLEALFDYFFVQPSILKKKRDALNAKLKEAGRPKMK